MNTPHSTPSSPAVDFQPVESPVKVDPVQQLEDRFPQYLWRQISGGERPTISASAVIRSGEEETVQRAANELGVEVRFAIGELMHSKPDAAAALKVLERLRDDSYIPKSSNSRRTE